MAAAQARMASVNQMMAAQTQAANAALAAAAGLADGSAARRTVTITGMRQIGMLNFDLLVEFDLTVLPDGMPPYPATTQQRVSQMQVGRLAARPDPAGLRRPGEPRGHLARLGEPAMTARRLTGFLLAIAGAAGKTSAAANNRRVLVA